MASLPDAIFWDWDGTIVDSYQFLNDAHNNTLRKLGMNELEKGKFKEFFGKERMYIFSAIYGNKKDEAINIFKNQVIKNNNAILPMAGVVKVLKLLHNKGVILGIVTNKIRYHVEKELENTGLKTFLPIVVCSKEALRDKPYPDPLLLAIEKSGLYIQKNDIWYIGDTETDLLCAKAAGCKSIFLKGHIDTDKLLLKYNPYASFDNYSSFKDFLVAI